MNQVMKILKDMDLTQKDQDFGLGCSLKVRVRLSCVPDFIDRLSGIDGLAIEELQ